MKAVAAAAAAAAARMTTASIVEQNGFRWQRRAARRGAASGSSTTSLKEAASTVVTQEGRRNAQSFPECIREWMSVASKTRSGQGQRKRRDSQKTSRRGTKGKVLSRERERERERERLLLKPLTKVQKHIQDLYSSFKSDPS